MTQKYSTDSELLMVLNSEFNSKEEQKETAKHTLESKTGICYNVDLQGKLGTVCAGIKTSDKGYSFKLNGYPFHRVTFTISGQAEISDNEDTYTANAGSIYYLPPQKACTVSNKSSKEWKHAYIHFIGSDIAKLFTKVTNNTKKVWNISNPGEIQSLFENIIQNCLEQSELSQVVCDSYLRILLIKLNSMIMDSREHSNASRLNYLECYNYINNNFSKITCIQDVSENCYISKIYLCRLFKRYANTSPMVYVTKLKMNKAALLLMQTDYSIKKISFMLNFDNQYYFSRAFKKTYKVSPKNYRLSMFDPSN